MMVLPPVERLYSLVVTWYNDADSILKEFESEDSISDASGSDEPMHSCRIRSYACTALCLHADRSG